MKKTLIFIGMTTLCILSTMFIAKKTPLLETLNTWLTPQPHSFLETQSTNTAPLITKHITIYSQQDKNKERWMLKSPEASFFSSLRRINCKNIECSFFEKGKKTASLTSPQAIIDRNENTVVLPTRVKGAFQELQFSGTNVMLSFSHHTISTDEWAQYTHPFFTIEAQKSRMHIKKKTVHLFGGVRSEFSFSPASDDGAD